MPAEVTLRDRAPGAPAAAAEGRGAAQLSLRCPVPPSLAPGPKTIWRRATIGKDIVRPDVINVYTVGAAMVGIVLWSVLAWFYGLPTSESHALVAALIGAGLATGGLDAVLWVGWRKVLVGLVFSHVFGFFGGLFLMTFIFRTFAASTPATVGSIFGRLTDRLGRFHVLQPRHDDVLTTLSRRR